MIRFRPHLGPGTTLDESMAQLKEFKDVDELIIHLHQKFDLLEKSKIVKITVAWYTHDERIGWDSHIVIMEYKTHGPIVLGFTDTLVDLKDFEMVVRKSLIFRLKELTGFGAKKATDLLIQNNWNLEDTIAYIKSE